MADDLPDHLKFGYKTMVEKEEIRKRLIAEGHPDDATIIFAVSKAYTEAHKNDLTFSQQQDLARWNREKWITPQPRKSNALTADEIEWLADRLAGVNDPIGVAILSKLKGQSCQ